ncbi:GNAT family N-acetyltransferase [Knoellia sp. CPCC 206435]|uniref:GNAT family N-acetyltransferase n=1 Tax=Knoellia terrae TaxID=3404797 RepID=UPI003B42F0F2
MTDDLDFETLDLHAEDAADDPRVRGWLDAILRGFLQGRPTDGFREKWLLVARADGAVNRGVWDSPAAGLPADVPVATFAHFVKDLNAGASMVPAWMITDVTVAPTHRRRGLMRRLMTENLEAAVAADVPVAVLTASEGGIYQRFGFGPATREARVRVDTSSRFRLRDRPRDGGRVLMADPGESWPALAAATARHHEVTRGALGRPAYYEEWLSGYDWDEQSEDRKLRLGIRVDPDGEPDGYVAYTVKEEDDAGEVKVHDLVTANATAYLDLWQFLADIDLAPVVTAPAPAVDPLAHALVDHRVRRVTSVPDHLWVRILDVRRCLEARPWFADGSLVLSMADPLGHAEGAVRIDASGGRAAVTPSRDAPDVTLDVETLGALYLGDVAVDPLARAGRVRGSDEALARFADLADGSPSPHCVTHF